MVGGTFGQISPEEKRRRIAKAVIDIDNELRKVQTWKTEKIEAQTGRLVPDEKGNVRSTEQVVDNTVEWITNRADQRETDLVLLRKSLTDMLSK